MGLFDKMKKKSKEEVAVAPTPDVTVEQVQPEVAQEVAVQETVVPVEPIAQEPVQGIVLEQPVYDNIFNADGTTIVEPQVTEVPLQEMQIQNVAEPTTDAQGLPVPEATAATIDNPVPAVAEQTGLQVNPAELFEGGLTIEDEITQLVNEVVTQELNNDTTQPVAEVVIPEQPIMEQPIETVTPVEQVVENVVPAEQIIENPVFEQSVEMQPVQEVMPVVDTFVQDDSNNIYSEVPSEIPTVANSLMENVLVEQPVEVVEQPIGTPIVENPEMVVEEPTIAIEQPTAEPIIENIAPVEENAETFIVEQSVDPTAEVIEQQAIMEIQQEGEQAPVETETPVEQAMEQPVIEITNETENQAITPTEETPIMEQHVEIAEQPIEVTEQPIETSLEESVPTLPIEENTPLSTEQVIEEPTVDNSVSIEDIVQTEENFIPQEIMESQQDNTIVLETPDTLIETEPLIELNDNPTNSNIIPTIIDENMLPDETSIEPIAENQVETVSETSSVENIAPEEQTAIEESPIVEETSTPEENTIVEETPDTEVTEIPSAEEQNTTEEPTIAEESPVIEEQEISPIIAESTEEEIPIIEEETTAIAEETPAIEEETEEIKPIIEEEVSIILPGEDQPEETAVIEEENTEINISSDEETTEEPENKPLIEEETSELNLGEPETEVEQTTEAEITPADSETPEIPITEEEIPIDINTPENEENVEEETPDTKEEPTIELSPEENADVSAIYGESTPTEEPVSSENEVSEENSVVEEAPASEVQEEKVIPIESDAAEIMAAIQADAEMAKEETQSSPFETEFPQVETSDYTQKEIDLTVPTMVEVPEDMTKVLIAEATPTKFCDNCGIMLNDNPTICPSCGEPID